MTIHVSDPQIDPAIGYPVRYVKKNETDERAFARIVRRADLRLWSIQAWDRRNEEWGTTNSKDTLTSAIHECQWSADHLNDWQLGLSDVEPV
jgi:hypothetical protein